MATGAMPDVNTISNGTIGTHVVFGNAENFRKRPMENLDDDWTNGVTAGAGPSASISVMGNIDPNLTQPNVNADGGPVNGMVASMVNGLSAVPQGMPSGMPSAMQPGQTIDPGIVAPGAGGIGVGVGVGSVGMSNGNGSTSGRANKRAKKVV